MKKYLFTLLIFLLGITRVYAVTQPETGISANPAFDDYNFYKCVVNAYNNTNRTSYIATEYSLTDEELASISNLYCYPSNYDDDSTKISSTKGLEKITGLTSLVLENNQLTNIDVSQNTALTSLRLSNNQLTSIDLSHNTALTSLYLYNDQLTSIDVSNNTNLNYLSVDENVEVIGASDDVSIQYVPIYMFSNNDLKFNSSMLKSGKYEYTLNISNSINNLAVSMDITNNKGYYYTCPDDTLCGGYYLYELLYMASENGQATINGNEINISYDNLLKEVNDYSKEIDIDSLIEEQCSDKNDCDVYYNNQLVESIHEGITIAYKEGTIIAKYDEDNRTLTIYRNGKEIYILNEKDGKAYTYISELKEGNNVLKIYVNESQLKSEYTINIIRSEKELDNNPNEELNNILDDIVNNNIDNSPNTGNYLSIIVSLVAIILVGLIYFIFYKKVKKKAM